MKFHDELNPKLWTKDNELKQEVAEKLEEITQAFIEYLDIPLDAIEDVIITGSSANYNYTPQSDLDLHLRVDYDKVHEDCPIVEGYLWSMKAAFNKDHDISIYGVPVEVYAENVDIPAVSNGVYSLADDKWVKFPEKIPPTDNDLAVQAKFNELKEASERIEDSEVAEELLDKIYAMRKAGLADVGEFSTENMAFKMLRNEGILERLKKMKKQKIDKQLSLESYNEEDISINNFNESWNTYSVQYQVIDRNDRISTKRKEFKTEKAMQNWITKQEDNPNFYGILATSYPDEINLKENNEDNEDIPEEQEKISLKDINNWFESKTLLGKQDDPEFYIRSAVRKWPQLRGHEKELRDNLAKEKAKNHPWYPYMAMVTNTLRQLGLFEPSIKEDYEDDDYEDIPEEMHKERYVTYFETQEGRQKYTIYHVYTDSTDDSYNELCDKSDNQLGMYSSYKELKDALKEKAEKIAKQQGWKVKSIENLGEDDDYYRERNKWESITNNQLSSESFIKVSKKLKEVMEERPPMTFDQLINKFKDNIEEYKIQGKDVYDNLNDIIKETLPIYVEDMINIYKNSEDYFDPHLDDTLEDELLEAISQALNTYFIRNMNDLI